MAVRVVLADDNYLVREGLARAIEGSEIEVVASCADRDALLKAVDEQLPDVVLTDIRMPPGDSDEGIQVAASLRKTNPSVGVVVLSQYADAEYAIALLDGGSGGRAYLLKDRIADPEQLISAIYAVAKGGSVIDSKVIDVVVTARTATSTPLDDLTVRERHILSLMAMGMTNAAIAEDVVITEHSVEKHVRSIFSKLGITHDRDTNRRVRAVLLYLANT